MFGLKQGTNPDSIALSCKSNVRGSKFLPFFLSSGFPFLTVANTISPDPAAGSLLRRPLIPFTAIIYRFLPPVLSAQLITAPTGRPSEIRNFPPEEPPRPRTRQT